MRKLTYLFFIIIFLFSFGFLFAQDEDTTPKVIKADPSSGYIGDTYEIDTVSLYTEEDPTYVVFTFDDFQIWAKVKGSGGTVLGEFYLPEADIITLSGTGFFNIELYSKSGSGDWSCKVMNETDYNILYNWDWDELSDLLDDIIAEPLSGYLENNHEINRISVDTIVAPTHMVFTWDDTMTLFAKIYNDSVELLATYDMSEGDVISLNDTGVYSVNVYTEAGYGNWSVEVMNDEDYNATYEGTSDVSYDSAKDIVNSFLDDMINNSDESLMDYISPSYISNNYLSVSDYEVNKYYPVDYIIISYDSDTGIVKSRIWGEDKGWIHGLDFKVVWENGRYYLYPSSHSDSYIDPWYKAETYLE